MTIHFDGVTMPASLAERGELTFGPPEVLDYDGVGLPILAATREATWKWRQLNPAEAAWLFSTLLAGQPARACDAGLRLYDPMNSRQETNFGYGVVILPTWGEIVSDVYSDVTLTIRGIR